MGATWHKALPWSTVKLWYREFRRWAFSSERRSMDYFVLDWEDWLAEGSDDPKEAQLKRVRRILGPEGYFPNWKFSYDKGEDLNLAFVFYDNTRKPENYDGEPVDEVVWWKYHVRCYYDEETQAIWVGDTHVEPYEVTHPEMHLEGVGWGIDEAFRDVENIFDAQNVSYRVEEWP